MPGIQHNIRKSGTLILSHFNNKPLLKLRERLPVPKHLEKPLVLSGKVEDVRLNRGIDGEPVPEPLPIPPAVLFGALAGEGTAQLPPVLRAHRPRMLWESYLKPPGEQNRFVGIPLDSYTPQTIFRFSKPEVVWSYPNDPNLPTMFHPEYQRLRRLVTLLNMASTSNTPQNYSKELEKRMMHIYTSHLDWIKTIKAAFVEPIPEYELPKSVLLYLTEVAWDFLFSLETNRIPTNYTKSIGDIALGIGHKLTETQDIAYIGGLFWNGAREAAFARYYGRCAGSGVSPSLESLSLGVRMHAIAGHPNKARAQQLKMEETHGYRPIRSFIPIIMAYNHFYMGGQAWKMFLMMVHWSEKNRQTLEGENRRNERIKDSHFEDIALSFVDANRPELAVEVYQIMKEKNYRPPDYIINIIMAVQDMIQDTWSLQQFSQDMLIRFKYHVEDRKFYGNWMKNWANMKQPWLALRLKEEMEAKGMIPDSQNINGLIRAFMLVGLAEPAEKLAGELIKERLRNVEIMEIKAKENRVWREHAREERKRKGNIAKLIRARQYVENKVGTSEDMLSALAIEARDIIDGVNAEVDKETIMLEPTPIYKTIQELKDGTPADLIDRVINISSVGIANYLPCPPEDVQKQNEKDEERTDEELAEGAQGPHSELESPLRTRADVLSDISNLIKKLDFARISSKAEKAVDEAAGLSSEQPIEPLLSLPSPPPPPIKEFPWERPPEATRQTFSLLINYFSRRRDIPKVYHYFSLMTNCKISPTSYTLNHLLLALLRQNDIPKVASTFKSMTSKMGVEPDQETWRIMWFTMWKRYAQRKRRFTTFLTPRQLFEYMAWYLQNHTEWYFSMQIWEMIVRSFLLAQDWEGLIVAINTGYRLWKVQFSERIVEEIAEKILQTLRHTGDGTGNSKKKKKTIITNAIRKMTKRQLSDHIRRTTAKAVVEKRMKLGLVGRVLHKEHKADEDNTRSTPPPRRKIVWTSAELDPNDPFAAEKEKKWAEILEEANLRRPKDVQEARLEAITDVLKRAADQNSSMVFVERVKDAREEMGLGRVWIKGLLNPRAR